MGKEFVPYEQALALKELGLDEPCICFQYDVNSVLKFVNMSNPKINSMLTYSKIKSNPHLSLGDEEVIVPTFSQAFKWFRENYRLDGKPEYFLNDWYCYIINDMKEEDTSRRLFTEFPSHEEAELECLKKLIEIVKEK
jgi:hypothetical protein